MVWALPTNSFRIVRRVLGVVLLIAAALKGYAVATEPVIGTGILGTRWFAIAVVNVELFCGMWLLTDWLPVWTWRGAVALFSLFAVISISKIIAGEASCGCFGRVLVSPWWTLGFDLTAIGALAWSRPSSSAAGARSDGSGTYGYAMAMPAIALIAIAVPANVLMASYRPSVLAEDDCEVPLCLAGKGGGFSCFECQAHNEIFLSFWNPCKAPLTLPDRRIWEFRCPKVLDLAYGACERS